jgi:phytoene synthase
VSETAFSSHLDKWLATHPAQRLAMPYLDEAEHAGHLALAALEHEWIEAAYGVREPQVAAVKLNWWAEELAGAPASGGRHPLTRALFSARESERVTLAHWLAPVQAALGQQDLPTAADYGQQLGQAEGLHGALARLETLWWYGPGSAPARAERVAALDHLLYAAAQLDFRADRERLALPMARMARHGLDRDGLRNDSSARRDALRAQLCDIEQGYREAASMPGPLSLFRGLDMRENRRLLCRARRADDPLQALQKGFSRPAAGSVFRAWSAARAWRRAAQE